MNAHTGQVYDLDKAILTSAGQAAQPGDLLTDEHFVTALPVDAPDEQRDLMASVRRALERKEALVAVSEEATQRLRLGERELRRRRGRRRLPGPPSPPDPKGHRPVG